MLDVKQQSINGNGNNYRIMHYVFEFSIEYLERTTDHGQAIGKLDHLRLRVECTLFCNLQSRA
jgi:hypothetical protein